MGKVVNLTQSNLLPLIDALKENVELDTYTIGGEKDAPVGGRYYHVQNEDDSNIEEDINFDKLRRPINENKYDDLFNKVTTDLENFKKQGEIKYGEKFWYNLSWMKNKHPRIEVDPKDIKIYNALEEKSNKIARLWNMEDENENSLDSSDSVDNGYDIISLAIDEFGLTYDLRQCGYILPDGRLLNFGSDGYRETDHRQIAAVYKDNNIKIWDDEYRYNYVVDFMNHGAIRCDLHSGILDMTQEPTNEQYRVLSDFIRRAVDVDIDFTDNKGNTLHSVSYSNKRAQAVIADIRRYYEDGIKPMGNVQYENKKMNNSHLIIESQESKSIAAAKKLVMQRLNYNEQEADEFIRIKLRNDLPVLRTPQGGKFILGVTRMFCDGELRTANDIGNLNSTLKLVASDAHINEYDRNLNNLSCQELIQRFAKAMSDNLEAEKDEIGQMTFNTPSDYEIVRIDSFEQAEEYGDYVSWCVTHDSHMFDSYTSDGINQFYFCLKNGFEGIEEVESEGCPLDEYGLSMIAVSVNENGMLNTCTCRWNHDNGGDDSIMNAKEISQVIGMNFFEVFKPNNKWKDLLTSVMQRLENGEDPRDVFDNVDDYNIGFVGVELNGKWNFISQEGRLLSDQWFDNVGYFSEGFVSVKLNGKWNFISQEGRLLSDQWFDNVGYFSEGFASVGLNGKCNFINQEGRLLSGQWFDYANDFRYGFAMVKLNDNVYKIDTRGNLSLSESNNTNKKILIHEDQLKVIKENLEFEVDSSDIDLSSFKKKTELAPSIWRDGETLDSKIRLKLLDIADDFWEFVNLTWVEPKAIIITGSICNFNWSQYSDIDLHIIVDFNEIDEKTDFVREYLDMKKNDWNNEHENLKIMGFQVELYVQNIDEDVEAGGIYDLEENKWIKKPNEDDLKPIGLNKYDIKNKAAEIMTIIDDMHDALNHTNDAYEIRQIGDDAEHLWKKVKQMRKDSLGKDGEMGLGNIVYKCMRRMGYLDKLFDLRTAVYDRTNSISEGVSYDAFKSNQSLRYKLIYSMINDGYLFHGNDGEWESFDKSKIKGGSRGIYGYGAYFTNAAYKCEEYGNDFMVLDANNFIFLNIDEKVHKGMNIFKEKENDYHYLNNGLDNARNNNEYDYYSAKLDEYNENVDKELLQKFIRLIDNSDDDITYRILNSNVGGYEDISERISMLYLALGYDGFVCGNQFVVFNFDKLNEYLVKDKEELISKYIDDLNIHETTDGKSNELLLEYLDKDHNIQLYKYFNYWSNKASEYEKVIDIIDNCPYTLVNYLKKIYEQYPDFLDYLEQINGDEDLLYDDTFINEIVNFMDERDLCGHFLSLVMDLADYYELPSWLTMDFNRVVKNEWCIHFGSDSDSISKEGFTGGTPDINHLAYTNAGAQKHQSGYDFAFAINDRSVDYNEYGDEAVIFRTSGVEVYHCGDGQNQVIFWGPNVKNFIPIHQDNGDWVVYGAKGQILVRRERPSEIAIWATENLPQYRKQIMSGKNGYIPTMSYWDENERKVVRKPYPLYRNESIRKYLTLLKESFVNEEIVADGNSEHNPYAKRWRIERDALKDFLNNYGKIMTSKENGKQYKVYYDQSMSELIGYNYCICIQWNPIEMEVGSTPYIRALDKFTNRIFQASFDDRGRDNLMGTSDDLTY